MGESNVHKHSLFVNVLPKYTQSSVEILNGVGLVPAQEFYQSAEVTFGETTENVTINNKSFTISDTGYSGGAVINYYAKDFCRLYLFSLYASGISQVQTFIARLFIKIYGSASMYSLKNIIASINVKEKSNNWKLESVKNAITTIGLSFILRGVLSCLKKISSSIKMNFEMSDHITAIKVMSANFDFQVYGDADLTVATYRPLSDFSTNTLEDLLGNALSEMIYTEV